MMKKIISLIFVLGIVLGMFGAVSASGREIYVSTEGNDNASGSVDAPVLSLEKACQLAGADGIVYIMEGTYKVSSSAKALNGMTIQNYNGGKVTLNASSKIDASKFQKVTDEAILNRVVEENARENIVFVKLSDAGITEFGQINMSGMNYPESTMPPQLIVNGQTLTLARYPDNDYMLIDEVLDPSVAVGRVEDRNIFHYENKGIKFRADSARTDKWMNAKDIWVFGYFMHDWAEANLSAVADPDIQGVIKTKYPSMYGVTAERRFYVHNLLEEISVPGEWYLDRDSGILYLYPVKPLSADDCVEFVTFDSPFIIADNADNVTVKGIEFTKGLDMGIRVSGGKNVTISDCLFADICNTAVQITGTVNGTIEYCTFKNSGSRCVTVESGDRQTLASGNCKIINNRFDGFSMIRPTNSPAVWLRGVGNTVAHNEMSNGKNIAIWFGGNNHIIEYNNIYNVCTDTADAGAIYAGRDWAGRGNEVRYNYIHDFDIIDTNTGMKVQAIYLDDMFSSAKVYGNIIKNVPSVALYGGGRYNTFENNIILNCEEPFVFDARGINGANCGEDSEIMANLKSMPYKGKIWSEAYPELSKILNDEYCLPKYNVIRNNVSYRVPEYNLDNNVAKYGTVENNIMISSTKDFVDYKKGNLNLKEDAEIFKKLPDFKATDFSKIGIQKREEKTVDSVLKNTVALKINQSKTFVFGKQSAVDANNSAVAPKIINNRTLVPVRFIAESFGGEVEWNEQEKKVTITHGESVIKLYINKTELTVDGKTTALDVPAQILESRTMLPLRAVVEALGMNVFWDGRGLIVIGKDAVLTEADTSVVDGIIQKF